MNEYLLGLACLTSVSVSALFFVWAYRDCKNLAIRMNAAMREEISEYREDVFQFNSSLMRYATRLEALEAAQQIKQTLATPEQHKEVFKRVKKQLKKLS